MLPRWLTAFFLLFQEPCSARRDAQIRFLKLQVEILQSPLPANRVIPDPAQFPINSRMERHFGPSLGLDRVTLLKSYKSLCNKQDEVFGAHASGYTICAVSQPEEKY